MAVSTRPWDGSPARFPTPAAYCASCLVDMNEAGAEKAAAKCKLPVKEPGGAVNANAMRAAAAALSGARGGVDMPPDMKRMAARKLMRMMGEAGMTPPDAMRRMAGMGG